MQLTNMFILVTGCWIYIYNNSMQLKNMSILVTGGAGFIGSNIVEYLVNNNTKKIRILDNLITGKMANIQNFLKNDNVEFVYGDISKLEDCKKAVKDMDVICHQAALGSVPRSINDPLSSHLSNVNGFLNILLSAKEVNIKRVVYASSSSVYGDNKTLPKVENNTGNVLSPYAATKAIDEIYSKVFTNCYGMECIGLRYFNIFGPRQDPNGAYAAVIPKFIDLIKNGKRPIINGDGSFSRDFTYVENAVQANLLALTTNNKECFGEAFNIGAGGRTTLIKLVNNITKELKCDIKPIFGKIRDGDISHSNANINKAKSMLGYFPTVNFEEGIKKLITIFL
jgi:UDP-N-acetylglucosamine/UDP-N-acetylgalactosamine 4-epimerase